MRLFTAIEIPPEVRDRLRTFVELLRPKAKLSWSPVENLHITTKFIGEWPEARLPELTSALQMLMKPGEIEIAIRGVGWFPDERHPRVFWAGVQADDRLAVLARSTDEAVVALGLPKEQRPYSPHLTLARIREHVELDALRQTLDSSARDFGCFRAVRFALYLSAGGKYTQLSTVPLS